MSGPDPADVEAGYRRLQDSFSEAVAGLDGGSFRVDRWRREEGGGGESRVLQGDGPIEKAAVLFSAVSGDTPAGLSERLAAGSARIDATGLSIIVHPRNPHAPTFHANLRHLRTDAGPAWFGGGADLTPHYLYEEDVRHFHGVLAAACRRHPVADYGRWKAECDAYFRIRHREEARGVGGIFFDHLTDRLDEVWAFHQDLGEVLAEAYLPILERRVGTPYGEWEETWQSRRRGRYAEFNLVWDRGTRFGLETGGRIESILASLPPRARWDYGAEPEPGTREAEMLALLRGEPRAWA